jgi:CubicO group peptidase (beta-lactamase class C family)
VQPSYTYRFEGARKDRAGAVGSKRRWAPRSSICGCRSERPPLVSRRPSGASKSALATFACVLLFAPAAAQERKAEPPGSPNGELDRFIEQRMGEAGIAGLAAAVIVDKQVVWTKGYGFADRARAVPFTPDAVMNIGSISKTFTGAALMHAVQDGKLSLDEDINAYLPFEVVNPHYPNAKITLRHLATHTSGITDRWEIYERTYRFDGTREPLGEFLRSYFVPGEASYSNDNFVSFRPGTHREYSNIGAALAGYIVELAVGEALNAYTKRHFFAPLRMANTGWFLSEIAPGKHATLYVAQDGITIPITTYELTTYPDGGVRTSVSDLAKFFIALLNDGEYAGTRILAKESAQEMLRFQYTEANKPDNVNLANEDSENSGIFWGTRFDVTRIGHNGSDPGVRTMMLSNLAKEVGVILFANTSLSGEDMLRHIAIFREIWKHAEALQSR